MGTSISIDRLIDRFFESKALMAKGWADQYLILPSKKIRLHLENSSCALGGRNKIPTKWFKSSKIAHYKKRHGIWFKIILYLMISSDEDDKEIKTKGKGSRIPLFIYMPFREGNIIAEPVLTKNTGFSKDNFHIFIKHNDKQYNRISFKDIINKYGEHRFSLEIRYKQKGAFISEVFFSFAQIEIQGRKQYKENIEKLSKSHKGESDIDSLTKYFLLEKKRNIFFTKLNLEEITRSNPTFNYKCGRCNYVIAGEGDYNNPNFEHKQKMHMKREHRHESDNWKIFKNPGDIKYYLNCFCESFVKCKCGVEFMAPSDCVLYDHLIKRHENELF